VLLEQALPIMVSLPCSQCSRPVSRQILIRKIKQAF